MFCKFQGEAEGFPVKETTYWVAFINGGVSGEITASIPVGGRDNYPIWSKKYPDFESMLEEWEIV